jgi:putative iron-dependent peroxidase
VSGHGRSVQNGPVPPQPGIFSLGNAEHCYVELDLADGADPRRFVAAVAALVGPDSPAGPVSCVVGFCPELWAQLVPEDAPADVRSFEPVEGHGVTMPATQRDGWFWLAGSERDSIFDSSLRAIESLEPFATVGTEVTAWVHARNRDLTGFIDGTENPPISEALDVVAAPQGPGAGSSVLLFQKWKHSPSFARLSVEDQEKVIGRTKADSIELDEVVMPADSHVSRNVVEEDGKELAIYRRNTAWGGATCHGTMFVGFCGTQHPLQVMLERMAGIPDGITDALTRHTTALSGAYYVVPSVEALARLVDPEYD